MRDLNDLYYFAQVVDHGGFAPAGRVLGIPKSKLSRRIAALEKQLDVRLIQRSTRHFSVTDLGRTFHAHCKAMLIEAEAAEEAIEVTRSEPRGTVRLTCPVMLLDALVGPMIAEFMVLHPHVDIHLEATNRRVDVIGEGIDLALRVRPPPLQDSDLVLRVLADRSQCLVGSPALVGRFGMPTGPAELDRFPSLDHGVPQNDHAWHLFGPDGQEAIVHHRPRFITRGMLALRDAALAGVGIVQLPTMMLAEAITRRELVRLLPDWQPRKEIVHAVFASRRGLLPSVRALVDFLGARFARLPDA